MSAVTPIRPPSLDDVVADMVGAAIDRAVQQRAEIRLLTDEQVAERLQVSEKTVQRLRESGRLRSVVVGVKSRRVRSDHLDAYITSLTGGAV